MEELIIKALPKESLKILMSRGCSMGDMLHGRQQFDAVNSLTKYEPEIPRTVARLVATGRQLKSLEKIVANPLLGNYTACICSFPTDHRAKALAAHIMHLGMELHDKKRKAGRTYPLWHRVFGGFNDPLRDKPLSGGTPSCLIISNLTAESSQYKLEKVRDILEKFNNIPRILVVGGSDPSTFFANKLYYPLTYGILLGADNKVYE